VHNAQLPDGLLLVMGLGRALLLADVVGWPCCCTGVLDRDAATGVLTPEHGVEHRGLSAPPSPCKVLRLNSMLLLLGSVMGRPCSRSRMTLMLSELERRSARSTKAREAAAAGP
jgi:hypothetical protein